MESGGAECPMGLAGLSMMMGPFMKDASTTALLTANRRCLYAEMAVFIEAKFRITKPMEKASYQQTNSSSKASG